MAFKSIQTHSHYNADQKHVHIQLVTPFGRAKLRLLGDVDTAQVGMVAARMK